MRAVFARDSAFMHGLDMVANAAVLTLLTVACSLPLVTIGAALTASYETAWSIREGKGYLLRTYMSAFRRNFPIATALWAVLAATGLALAALWLFANDTVVTVAKIMLTLLWIIAMVWAWPLAARFENSVIATLRNALLFGGTSPITTLVVLVIPGIVIGLTAASIQWLPQGLYLLLVLGLGMTVQLQVPLFDHALQPYVDKANA